MSVSRICWDTGGIDPTIVYERSKKHGLFRVIPIKGASVYGKPVASMPRKRNKNGVYLTEIGTDTAKEQIYNRFTLTPEGDEPLPGAVHFPNNPDIFDLTEAQQLTAEEQVEKWGDGRKKILWDSKKRRNEALDCFVYALAALRNQYFPLAAGSQCTAGEPAGRGWCSNQQENTGRLRPCLIRRG
ncbi:phage terminase large subunit [Escherichia coli]|uniref:Phage terminase large subunit n=1 Tax=Escherichia coli TaxID=562 RepID=A0A376LNZ2_ECOLX|nr:phage terminase large subunit [Escherichia coli]